MGVRKLRSASMTILVALLGALLLGTATVALAQEHDNEDSGRRGMYGTVESISEDGTTAVIMTRFGSEVTIDLTTTDLELEEGSRVAFLVQDGKEGQPLQVLRGLVRPDRPQILHVTGAVVSKTATGITVIDATGREHVMEIPEGVEISVNPGDHAVVITHEGNGEPPKAQAAISASAIADQMKAHAATLRDRAQAGDVPVSTAAERIQRLESRLEAISTHLQTVFSGLLDKVGPEAKAAIESAMAKFEANFQQARAGIAQEHTGLPEEAGPPEETPVGGPPERPLRPDGTPGGGSE